MFGLIFTLDLKLIKKELIVPARSRDEYVQEAAAPRGGDDMAD